MGTPKSVLLRRQRAALRPPTGNADEAPTISGPAPPATSAAVPCGAPLVSTRHLLAAVLLLRLAQALLQRTAFSPDEFWQSLEPAYFLAFGSGNLTWEWTATRLRGWLHPGLFACVYFLLGKLGLEGTRLLILGPRLLQGLIAFATDMATWRLGSRLFSRAAGRWALLFSVGLWFNGYALTRTLGNSLETCLLAWALALWPCAQTPARGTRYVPGLALAALAAAVRPTALVYCLPLGLVELASLVSTARGGLSAKRRLAVGWVLLCTLVGMTVFALNAQLDRRLYALAAEHFLGPGEAAAGLAQLWSWRPTLLNFLRFNFTLSLSSFYGVHGWLWYWTEGITVVVGVWLVPLAAGVAGALARPPGDPFARRIGWLLTPAIFFVVVHSLLAHKEHRFILPVVPACLAVAGAGMERLVDGLAPGPVLAHSEATSPAPRSRFLAGGLVMAGLLANLLAFLFFGFIHQAAPIGASLFLRRMAPGSEGILMLTPCHLTPLASYLGDMRGTPVRFTTCEPPLPEEALSPDFVASLRRRAAMDVPGSRAPLRGSTSPYADAPGNIFVTVAAGAGYRPETDLLFSAGSSAETLQTATSLMEAEVFAGRKPSFVVLYEGLLRRLGQLDPALLEGYELCAEFSDGPVRVDSRYEGQLLILCRDVAE
ncbi:hypothetical protein H696_02501 [Fonticula alba]|uniref:Mannosyltransferase n=1 Tax=Fonticula alba TaxID=691883 RepID=A0A058ZC89_FONAL|nr:hypothetical protein H696_02501 [Fonticula alba]KCV71561.1 hypothetical protein H696_02501 [Fonticula alba]|eukprot:XP_009494684.1 hypothetical protein H696_02501 [Fonticula alba]